MVAQSTVPLSEQQFLMEVFKRKHGPHPRACYGGSLFTFFLCLLYLFCLCSSIFLTFWFLSQLIFRVVGAADHVKHVITDQSS